MSVSKILAHRHLWYFKTTKIMIYIAAFGVGLKCPRKIRLNTQCPPPFFRPPDGPALEGHTPNGLDASTVPFPFLVKDTKI